MITITTTKPGKLPVTRQFDSGHMRIGLWDDDIVLASAACSRDHAE